MTIAAKLLQMNGVKEDIRDAIESFGFDLSESTFFDYAQWICDIGTATQITITADPTAVGTIADDLTQLSNIKTDIKNAIESKGIDLTGVPFSEYDDYIYQIPVAPPVQVTVSAGEDVNGGTVTGSGTYASGQTVTVGGTPVYGRRVRSITVNGTVVSTGSDTYSFVPSESTNTVVVNFMPDYLTFTAVNGDVNIGMKGNSSGTNYTFSVEFAPLVDDVNDEVWTEMVFHPNGYNGTHPIITLTDGNTFVVRKKDSDLGCSFYRSSSQYWQKGFTFDGDGEINASGNLLSMFDKTCTCTDLTLAADGGVDCFYYILASNKILTAPKVPYSATVPDYGFYGMFTNSKITQAPELPATTLGAHCYDSMFLNCNYLTQAPELPATTLSVYCYNAMFSNTRLATAPELPATTLANYCYNRMFDGCVRLKEIPDIKATTFASRSCAYMFQNCTSLKHAELKATILGTNSCIYMFAGCTSLVSAELPDTTLVNGCYNYMFDGCTRLNYIKALFTDTPSTTYTSNWVRNVASNGTFYKNPEATWTTTGVNGVPTNWVVVNEDYKPLKFTANTAGSTIQLGNSGSPSAITLEVSSNGRPWTTHTVGDTITLTNEGDYVMFRGDNSTFSSSGKYYKFAMTGSIAASGKVTSLYSKAASSKTIPANYFFNNLFADCSALTNAPELPATTLTTNCYLSMFSGCTGLTEMPELPATTLKNSCYKGMFRDCTGLLSVGGLQATTLAASCYESMFYGCTSISSTQEVLPATQMSSNCYQNMFYGCTSLVYAPELPATLIESYSYDGMFRGCSLLEYVKCMATTFTTSGTQDWLTGVSETGIFVKNSSMNNWTTGGSGIPTGWTVESYTPE